jgi:hypothetical protein
MEIRIIPIGQQTAVCEEIGTGDKLVFIVIKTSGEAFGQKQDQCGEDQHDRAINAACSIAAL